jgi:hypothetical protein
MTPLASSWAHPGEFPRVEHLLAVPAIGAEKAIVGDTEIEASLLIRHEKGFTSQPIMSKEDRLLVIIEESKRLGEGSLGQTSGCFGVDKC